MTRVGVLDLESFFPATDRFALAMRLNNVLAAPGFAAWLDGTPLDVAKLLYTAAGRPRDRGRLDRPPGRHRAHVLRGAAARAGAGLGARRSAARPRCAPCSTWTSSSASCRRRANPPSKVPLLTLLKQARAFGLGCVLATQNPVDLDYKALANAGTWFLGRLQTERDKARVLDGLEGVASGSGQGFDRAALDTLLSSLDKRVFLLHNVHDKAPLLFQTRWAMSYLRGPMGRDEIRALMDPVRATAAASAPPAGATAGASIPMPVPTPVTAPGPALPAARPIVPPDVPQYFAPGRGSSWVPMLVGAARVSYSDAKLGLDETNDVVVWTPLTEGPVAVDWEHAEPADFAVEELTREPAGGRRVRAAAAAGGQAQELHGMDQRVHGLGGALAEPWSCCARRARG